MKKVYINELETERRNELIKKNEKLIFLLQQDLYNINMDLQYEASRDIMNKEAESAIQYHDNYNSFYHTLKDWRKFITNIDPFCLSYKGFEIYNKIMDKINIIDTMDQYSENYDNLDSWLFEQTEKVLNNIDEYLRGYEKFPSEEDAIKYANEMGWLDEYYIEERKDGTTDGVIRKDVAFTECYI